jgi:hydrogenase nickel incorporation protein HypA/HybF
MHELPITQSLLDLALEHAERAGGGRITNLYLVIGDLSGGIDDSVQVCWDIVTEGTAAAGAVLHFQRVRIEFECLDCRRPFNPGGEDYRCPVCNGPNVRLIRGNEFNLEAIDLEQEEVADGSERTERSDG